MNQPRKSMRTIVVHVQDLPGVLNRVASLFRRRNFNIHSLNVSTTNEPGISRMTILCEADDDTAARIAANLYKLVNVVHVDDITNESAVERDLALIKVRAKPEQRAEILQLCEVFRARPIDVGPTTLIVEITGTQSKIDGLVQVLVPFGIAEMVQTGTVAMTRGDTPDDVAQAIEHAKTYAA